MSKPPFTAAEIDSFNNFQASGMFHPLTCGNRHLHSRENEGVLVADENGLHCPTCDYRQDWCDSFVTEGIWKMSVPYDNRDNRVNVAEGLAKLKAIAPGIWDDVDPEEYVREQRGD